ncbi:MAG TPA: group II intron reverse transcriptase/maturase [Gemmatimonadales bacterium]|nr:group II intron reverse transcriptase/maturase [Gemmatimonadales bacterium]
MSLRTPEKIRTLQNKLYLKAKGEPGYRFYLLYDKVWRADILLHAYRLCRANGGAPGVDGVTFDDLDEAGVEGWLAALAADLREETYKPEAVLRVRIPKPDGGERVLGIPTVRDRVAQQAAKLVLEPIFEADFEPNAYGYRPKRGALDAVQEVHRAIQHGEVHVVDADLSKYFDTIPHRELMQSVARRVSDGKMLRLIKMWLKAPAEESDGRGRKLRTGGERSQVGTPQGGVISPLLANLYIHRLLKAWKKFGLERHLGARIINYADDLVILCRSRFGAESALKALRWIVERLGLRLNDQKTHLRDAKEEHFDFLGYTFGPMVSRRTGGRYLGVTPSKKRVKRFKQSLRTVLKPGNQGRIGDVVVEVNRRLTGWGNYFCVGTLGTVYRALDVYTCMLLRRFLVRRHKVPGRGTRRFSDQWLREQLGLRQLYTRRKVAPLHA